MIKIIKDKILLKELKKMAQLTFGNLVKAVIDVEKKLIAVNGELHANEETFLLKEGSKQKDLWGINIYPDLKGNGRIEFDSMINIRPSSGNKTRSVDSPLIRKKIISIINQLVKNESST